MAYIINPSPIELKTFVLDNAAVQSITAFTDINLQVSTGRPFAIIGASLQYQGTNNFSDQVAAGFVYLTNIAGAGIIATYQDASFTRLLLRPGEAFNFVVNQDPSAPSYGPKYVDDELNIVFDADYSTGDGIFIIKIAGFYF